MRMLVLMDFARTVFAFVFMRMIVGVGVCHDRQRQMTM